MIRTTIKLLDKQITVEELFSVHRITIEIRLHEFGFIKKIGEVGASWTYLEKNQMERLILCKKNEYLFGKNSNMWWKWVCTLVEFSKNLTKNCKSYMEISSQFSHILVKRAPLHQLVYETVVVSLYLFILADSKLLLSRHIRWDNEWRKNLHFVR